MSLGDVLGKMPGVQAAKFAMKGGLPGLAIRALQDKKKPQPGAAAPASTPAGGGDAAQPMQAKRGGKIAKKNCGGGVKKMAKGGAVTRGDGCAKKGHTKGRIC